jgi:predicted ribosomally synthesized peptide with nif11-like leader
MTTNSAREFIELLERDASLQTKFSIASPNSTEAIIDFADSRGYVFTKDELLAALKRYPDSRIAAELRQRAH